MAWIARNPSANVLTLEVKLVNVLVDAAYFPTVTEGENCWKNASEVDVTLRVPCAFQTMRASYNCSATAAVVRYHGYGKSDNNIDRQCECELTFPPWYTSSGYRPVATAALDAIPLLIL